MTLSFLNGFKKKEKGILRKIHCNKLLLRTEKKKRGPPVTHKSRMVLEKGRDASLSSEGFQMRLPGCTVELEAWHDVKNRLSVSDAAEAQKQREKCGW